jgi:hypothetical protein
MNPELKPCPFCGSPARVKDRSVAALGKTYAWFEVQCANAEGLRACGVWTGGKSLEEAAEKWNRRTPPLPEAWPLGKPPEVATTTANTAEAGR